MKRYTWLLCLVFFITVLSVQAQENQPEPEDFITFPEPVNVLQGKIDIIGTVTAPYFVQWRELGSNLQPVAGPNSALWSPAVLPQNQIVRNGVLGTWDTTLIPDGVYELQLVVNNEGTPIRYTVRPIRIANKPSPLAGGRLSVFAGQFPVTSTPFLLPGVPGTPTPFIAPSNTPLADVSSGQPIATANAILPPTVTPFVTQTRDASVTATIQANVRSGDSTSYPVVGFLNVGDTARIIGASNRSSWFLIRLADGTEGFISPSTVNVRGDTTFVQRVQPPPLPYTVTPVASSTPTSSANLRLASLNLSEDNPNCAEAFQITAVVENNGTGGTTSSGVISARDTHLASGTQTASTTGGFPELAPGEQFTVTMTLTVDTFYEEGHRVIVVVDIDGNVRETNEDDNTYFKDYTLEKTDCG